MSDQPPWDGQTERRLHVIRVQEEILTRLDQMNNSLAKVVRFIEGNGNPERGAIVRLDRLEQQGASRQRHIGWLWGSIGGLVFNRLWDFLTKSR